MEIHHEVEGTTSLVRLKGDLDVSATAEVEALLGRCLETSSTVIIDLSEVPFADSSGLGGLIAAYKRAKAANREIRLRRPSPIVAEILTITRMRRFFPVED